MELVYVASGPARTAPATYHEQKNATVLPDAQNRGCQLLGPNCLSEAASGMWSDAGRSSETCDLTS